MRRVLLPAALLAAIGLWQIAASTGAIAEALSLEDFLVPSPAEIAQSLWENRSLLAENAWVTLREMVFGILSAVAVGIGFATAMHRWRVVRDASYPLIVASQTIPIVVISPILVVWFGYGLPPKVFIIALVCFFPITIAALDGLRSVDPEAVKMMRSLDASAGSGSGESKRRPPSPSLHRHQDRRGDRADRRIFAEWAGSSSGLGHLIQSDTANFDVARQFATVAVLSAMALILMGLATLAERSVIRWR